VGVGAELKKWEDVLGDTVDRIDVGLLGYCGLYCGDCPGHTGEIADAAASLITALDRSGFDEVAAALFSEQLPHYAALGPALAFLSRLRCAGVCRAREEHCDIARCCLAKGLDGCHECNDFESCPTLARLEKNHGDSCIVNLRGIRRLGAQAWLESGERKWLGRKALERR